MKVVKKVLGKELKEELEQKYKDFANNPENETIIQNAKRLMERGVKFDNNKFVGDYEATSCIIRAANGLPKAELDECVFNLGRSR